MTEDVPPQNDARKLADVLDMHASPLPAVIAAFGQGFAPERHAVAVCFIRAFLDAAHASPNFIDVVPQVLTAYFILRHISSEAAQPARRAPAIAHAVKAAQHHELQRLESLLRDDVRIAESLKYKQTAPTGPKKQTARDAADLDIGRAHLLLKTVIFRLLLAQSPPASVSDLFKLDRASLDAEADSWAATAMKPTLVEALSELKAAADAETTTAMGGALNRSVLLEREQPALPQIARAIADASRGTEVFVPPAHRVAPTMLPVTPNELRFLCAGSPAAALSFDFHVPSAEWKAVSSLLHVARTQSLSAAQHQTVATAAPKCLLYSGLTIPAFLDISEKNPQTAALLIQSASPAEPYLDALISLPGAAGCQRAEVMLASRKLLQPHQLTAYIKNMASTIRLQAVHKQELVSNFAVTLHQLVGSPVALAKADADIVVPLFAEYAASVPDVNSLWSSVLSK